MKNQKEKILEYLHKNGSISSFEAYQKLGITQLGARLDNLKKDGYFFDTEWRQSKRHKKPYKIYKLAEG